MINIIDPPKKINIVNDLTTGGTDKALSAEQGKVLQIGKMNHLQAGDWANYNFTNSVLETLLCFGFDFDYAEFKIFVFASISFYYKNITGINFEGSTFDSCSFSGTKFTDAKLAYISIFNGSFSDMIIMDTDLKWLEIGTMNGTSNKFINCDLSHSIWTACDLTPMVLTNCNFTDSDFSEWRHGSPVGQTYLYGNFSICDFSYCNFGGCGMSASHISDCNFSHSDFQAAFLSYSTLTNIDMSSCICDGLDFTNTIFNNVNISNSTFDSAIFTGATGLNPNINIALSAASFYTGMSVTWIDGRLYNYTTGDGFTVAE